MRTLNTELVRKIDADFQKTLEMAGRKRSEIEKVLSDCSGTVADCYKFLYAYMPMADVANYPAELFRDHVVSCLENTTKMPWADQIDDETFLNFVLMIRVNNENLEHYNDIIFNEVYPIVKDLDIEKAALAVNMWCFSRATYCGSDGRTVSPLTMMRNTNGRCGEESTFLTCSMRSVGIPARQCYCPRWCDSNDNHAWGEVLVNGKWRYLGACEPDPILDSGWYREGAARQLLTNTRIFSGIVPKGATLVSNTERIKEINTLSIYSENIRRVCFNIVRNGVPEAGVRFRLGVINYNEVFDYVDTITDSTGKVYFDTNPGDILVTAQKDGKILFTKADIRTSDTFEIDIAKAVLPEELPAVMEFELVPPQLDKKDTRTVPEDVLAKHRADSAAADKKRKDYKATFYGEESQIDLCDKYPEFAEDIKWFFINSQGNHSQVREFLKDDDIALRVEMLATLSKKDFGDFHADVLEKQFCHQKQYFGKMDEDIFYNYVLAPRIANEWLSAYGPEIDAFFSDEQKNAFRKDPVLIGKYVDEHIKDSSSVDYASLVALPYGLLLTEYGTPRSGKVLKTAICRALGIPSRFNDFYLDGKWYYMNGSEVGAEKTAWLKIETEEKDFFGVMSVTRYENDEFSDSFMFGSFRRPRRKDRKKAQRDMGDMPPKPDEIKVEPGLYRILTTRRLHDAPKPMRNALLVRAYHFMINDGEHKVVQPIVRDAVETQTVNIDIPQLMVKDMDGNEFDVRTLGCGIYGWLEITKEPTEHLFNEMLSMPREYKEIQNRVYFIVKKPEDFAHVTFKKILAEFPGIRVFYDSDDVDGKLFASIKETDRKLPLVVVADANCKIHSVSTGYNIGSAGRLYNALIKL